MKKILLLLYITSSFASFAQQDPNEPGYCAYECSVVTFAGETLASSLDVAGGYTYELNTTCQTEINGIIYEVHDNYGRRTTLSSKNQEEDKDIIIKIFPENTGHFELISRSTIFSCSR